MKTINNYAELVKEKHALNKTLAPVETDLTGASQAYAKGAKFIYNGIMYQAKTAIAQGTALVLNTNYEAAPNVETQIANEAAVRSQMGAKNLLIFDLAKIKEVNTNGTWTDNVYSFDGLTATFNSDGSISLSGTTSEWIAIKLVTPLFFEVLPANSYTLTGCPAGGSSLTYGLVAQFKDDATSKTLNDYGSGATNTYDINVSLTGGNVFVSLYPNIDFTGMTFKPMLRLAKDPDETYQPYAKTNVELTEQVSSLNTAIANKADASALNSKENVPTVLNATLAASATTLTFTDDSIGNNSRIRAYSDPFVLGLITDMAQSGTTVTLTCAAQASAVSVKLEVRN